MFATLLIPIVRHGLTALGASLVAKGYLDASGTDMIVGIGVNVMSLGWMLFSKLKKH
jgi:hypothetical protein